MENVIFNAAPQKMLRIKGCNRFFPVHHVYCIGRNYREHSLEMGHDPTREAPFFFQKNAEDLNQTGIFHYPRPPVNALPELHSSIHHEVELFIALKKGGAFLDEKDALKSIFGFGIALDLTKRELQTTLKQQGRPWEVAKAFKDSAPCSLITPIEKTGMFFQGLIQLYVNDKLCQTGDLKDMIWNIGEIISTLSQYFTLKAGDIILTGTPKGVGSIQIGDRLYATIQGLDPLTVMVE